MSVVTVREATLRDALKVIALSPAVQKVAGSDRTLAAFVTNSDRAYVGLVDGEIACMWGVIRPTLLSNRGYLWLILTEIAEEHKFLVIRHSQRIIEKLLNRYSVLIGECVLGDDRARKWMRLLGATFSQPEGKLIPFQIVGKHG